MPYNGMIMTHIQNNGNRLRERRVANGLTQAELAQRANISRTAVTAIEAGRIVPSVMAALSLARVLQTSVEDLFSQSEESSEGSVWAWQPRPESAPCWRSEIHGRTVLYPADSMPMLSLLPDARRGSLDGNLTATANETLVMACCDPAAGILASQFAEMTGLRLIVLPRSSRQSLEMLKQGLVHMAGLHLSTRDDPDRNSIVIQSSLGPGYRAVRLAQWQEGIAMAPSASIRSVRSAVRAKLNWIGREPGSGARHCLDRLLPDRPAPRRVARHHRGVAEAIQWGWADAGICVQLVCAEAGLTFIPVQQESFDVCFSTKLADDRRIQAFLTIVRSTAYRKQIAELPGYETRETGTVWSAN